MWCVVSMGFIAHTKMLGNKDILDGIFDASHTIFPLEICFPLWDA